MARLAGDQDTFSERLVSAPQALMRWASSGLKPGSSALGCLNPLTMFRFVLLIALIVLMPVYLLPSLLIRMAAFGRTSVKYSSAVRVTSGAPARWGYGVLDPPADAAAIQAGAAAIAARDAGFNPVALMNWAAAATALICQSRTSADASPARTFMANGLFRSYQALLELRAGAGVSCTASWRATGATLAEVISTPLFDEVRVRLQCAGTCCEQHDATGLTLRGSAEQRTWSEDLTFGRSAEATSPAAGGLPAQRCPSCGAPLDLDYDGACRYCHGIVTAGRHDWVLTGYRCEPW
jgi:hypothetical protein